MNPSRYFMPMMARNPMMYPNNFYQNFSISNLLSRFKSFNWKGMLNGVNKTLNVVNQTIPLVKEVKPMYDNVKNMFVLTKAFKKETTNQRNYKKPQKKSITSKINTSDTNKPNFFI